MPKAPIKYKRDLQDKLNNAWNTIDFSEHFPDPNKLREGTHYITDNIDKINIEDDITILVGIDGRLLSLCCKSQDLELNYTLSHSKTISGSSSMFNRMDDVQSEVDEAFNIADEFDEKPEWYEYDSMPSLDLTGGGFLSFEDQTTTRDFIPVILANNEFVIRADAVGGMTDALSIPHSARVLHYLNSKWAARGKRV